MASGGLQKELVAEDYCFICKDGGELLICDYGDCLKVYHPECVGKSSTFIETGSDWKCGWHSCYTCKKSSKFRCFCCPMSLCDKCFEKSQFQQVRENSMGFCRCCLKQIELIEKNSNEDYLNDRDKFLFKDYWKLIKDQEKISSEEIFATKTAFKDHNNLDCSDDHDAIFQSRSHKKRRLERKVFSGWGTKELTQFLVSIGKDCREPISRVDVSDIIKKYVYDNNLFVKKKKKVLCDDKLITLFRKKSVKLLKVYDLLERHYRSDNFDDYSFDDLENEEFIATRRLQGKNFEPSNVSETPKSCFALIVDKNINLIYLRRSLIIHLLENSEDFENKVIGSFVRVKNDPKDLLYSHDRIYQLGQVTGIKRTQENFEKMKTNVILRVSNVSKDVCISMLSDDDFKEEELEYLRQLVRGGQYKRLMIEELELKSNLLHCDITRHWIKREIDTLKIQIDRANVKGWRRELYDLIDRRELLRSEAEQTRLLNEIPKVIPDIDFVDGGNLNKCDIKINGPEEVVMSPVQSDSGLRSEQVKNSACKDSDTGQKKSINEKDEIEIIELDDDDNDDDDKDHTSTVDLLESGGDESDSPRWNYLDPVGAVQGPFPLTKLKKWQEAGFFSDDFKIWRSGQSPNEGVLLTDALRLLSHTE